MYICMSKDTGISRLLQVLSRPWEKLIKSINVSVCWLHKQNSTFNHFILSLEQHTCERKRQVVYNKYNNRPGVQLIELQLKSHANC